MPTDLRTVSVLYVDVYPYRWVGATPMYLTLLRRSDRELSNTWQAVSGKIRPSEEIAAAFHRQVLDKTGQIPVAIHKLDRVNLFYDQHYGTVMAVPCAAAQLSDPDIVLDDRLHRRAQWCTLQEAIERFVWPNQRSCLQDLDHRIRHGGFSPFHLVADPASGT